MDCIKSITQIRECAIVPASKTEKMIAACVCSGIIAGGVTVLTGGTAAGIRSAILGTAITSN